MAGKLSRYPLIYLTLLNRPQPNEPLPLSTFDRLEWPEYFSDLKAVSQIIHYPRSLSSVLPGNLNLGYVHMLISVDAVTEEEDARKEALDIIAGLSENQRAFSSPCIIKRACHI